MAYSNYPHGFLNGVVIRGVPLLQLHPGKVHWVNGSSVLPEGGIGGSNGNDGTYLRPYATIDYAIGKCTASRGDIIAVMPGHTETVIAAAGIDLDVAGVAIIGLGRGSLRPTVTFTTAAAASVDVAAANVLIHNILFVNGIDSQTHMLDVHASDVTIDNCEFREGAATQALSAITADTADNDSDRLVVSNSVIHMPTAGPNDGISLAKDFIGVRIEDCNIYGNFSNAGIDVPAGGNAQVNLVIKGSAVENLQTGDHAIQINGTGNTGSLLDNRLAGDTLAAIVDTGGLRMYENYVHDTADQSYAIVTGTAVS